MKKLFSKKLQKMALRSVTARDPLYTAYVLEPKRKPYFVQVEFGIPEGKKYPSGVGRYSSLRFKRRKDAIALFEKLKKLINEAK